MFTSRNASARRFGLLLSAGATTALLSMASTPVCAQDDAGGSVTPFDFADVQQIVPTSPVSGGNDPNASDDVLYILEANDEETAEILENEKGILRPNGRPVGQRVARRTHFFVNPSARAAAKLEVSKRVTVEAFVTGGAGAFRENITSFGTRATNLAGGVNANADLGLVNGAFAYEHRTAYAERFGPWRSSGDKVGATFNKTLPFFIRDLTVTPQVLTSRDIVNPARGSSAAVEATVGLTYNVSPKISLAASAGYGIVFLYGHPGFRHDDGLKALVGANYKVTEQWLLSLGASTNRTVLLGLPHDRIDASLSPSATVRYTPTRYLTFNVSGNYGRFVSTISGHGTFKYNVNPSVALSVPL